MKHNFSIYLLVFLTSTNILICSETLCEDTKTKLAKKIQSNMGWFPFLSYGKPDIETIKKSLKTTNGAALLERIIRSRLDFLMCSITYNGKRNPDLIIDPQEIVLGYEMALHTLSRHFQEFIAIFLITSTLVYSNVPAVKNGINRLLNRA